MDIGKERLVRLKELLAGYGMHDEGWRVRKELRSTFPEHEKWQRWQWEEDDVQLWEVRRLIERIGG